MQCLLNFYDLSEEDQFEALIRFPRLLLTEGKLLLVGDSDEDYTNEFWKVRDKQFALVAPPDLGGVHTNMAYIYDRSGMMRAVSTFSAITKDSILFFEGGRWRVEI